MSRPEVMRTSSCLSACYLVGAHSSWISPWIRFQTQTLIGALIEDERNGLLVLHVRWIDAVSLLQPTELALDATDLVCHGLRHVYTSSAMRDAILLFGVAKGDDGESIMTVASLSGEEPGDTVRHHIKLREVLLPISMLTAGQGQPSMITFGLG